MKKKSQIYETWTILWENIQNFSKSLVFFPFCQYGLDGHGSRSRPIQAKSNQKSSDHKSHSARKGSFLRKRSYSISPQTPLSHSTPLVPHLPHFYPTFTQLLPHFEKQNNFHFTPQHTPTRIDANQGSRAPANCGPTQVCEEMQWSNKGRPFVARAGGVQTQVQKRWRHGTRQATKDVRGDYHNRVCLPHRS